MDKLNTYLLSRSVEEVVITNEAVDSDKLYVFQNTASKVELHKVPFFICLTLLFIGGRSLIRLVNSTKMITDDRTPGIVEYREMFPYLALSFPSKCWPWMRFCSSVACSISSY